MSRMSADSLLAQYNIWLLAAPSSGPVAPCTDDRTIDRVRQRILEDPDLHRALQNDAFTLISSGLQGRDDPLLALQHLAGAFQTLEEAALHLYFTPWRREFHTIKTYSGHYVHTLEAALPQDAIFQALRRLNYEPEEDGTSLKIRVPPAPQALAMAALGFLAAQLECNILADLASCSGSTVVNGADLIQERRGWRGEDACRKRLQKLVSEQRTVPVAKSSSDVIAAANGEVFYQPQHCDRCHNPSEKHANGGCRTDSDHHVRSNPHQPCHTQVPRKDSAMHDCVFVEESVEQCCAQCHTFHGSFCSAVNHCRDKGHRITQVTPSEKMQAVMEEQRRKYQLHCCLQPGDLPHYRCGHCRQLHYINCKGVQQCRHQGHNASMIMLERDQKLWLQRSLMDLMLLCKNAPASDGASA
ncbi:spermatogenesis-associated protein 2-like protein isoform X2 [Eleutherodactylus coqui]|uniref:spermatogenesis-associated protein 2-like protein isoform X2 n=1 Tax=Eleutherodactylus coqui TaxID=57060 RepID=UPI003462669C